eukprot:363953-Chlamydomonas_euryale.AAC.12
MAVRVTATASFLSHPKPHLHHFVPPFLKQSNRWFESRNLQPSEHAPSQERTIYNIKMKAPTFPEVPKVLTYSGLHDMWWQDDLQHLLTTETGHDLYTRDSNIKYTCTHTPCSGLKAYNCCNAQTHIGQWEHCTTGVLSYRPAWLVMEVLSCRPAWLLQGVLGCKPALLLMGVAQLYPSMACNGGAQLRPSMAFF